jgi:hypothetical protein
MRQVMISARVGWFIAMMTPSFLGACVPSPEMQVPNVARFDIDGMNIVVEEGLALAFVDETKHLLGPNTHLHLAAATRSDTPDRVLGDWLLINVPAGTSVGEHDVRFTPLPGRETVWVNYRGLEPPGWSAYHGTVTLERLDGVGGRLQASFSELDLVDSCAQRRKLTNGKLDVRVGSENSYPVSEIDTSDVSEWAELGGTALIENNLMVELDGKLVGCPFVDFGPKIVPAADSGTGRDEKVLEMVVVCDCDREGADGIRSPPFGLSAYLPISGRGDVVVAGTQFFLAVNFDVNRTPLNIDDDEFWFPLAAPQLRYQGVGSELGARIDIELKVPLLVHNFEDPRRTKRLSVARMYGFVNRSLGQLVAQRSPPRMEADHGRAPLRARPVEPAASLREAQGMLSGQLLESFQTFWVTANLERAATLR